jgi:large subunit ribosomal protein L9
MQVVLLKDVEKIGRKGEVVSVRDGFGRNFLIPRKLALPGTRANLAFAETEKLRSAARKTRKKEEAQALAERLASVRLRVELAVGDKEKVFGSVTAQDVAEALKQEGYSLDKRHIRLPEPVKTLGAHTVVVELESGVKANVAVEVVKKPKS